MIENERVTARNLQEAVAEAGARACAGRPTVLAVQDTTDLLFKRAYRTEGLGYINGYKTPGLLAHSTLAVGEDGAVLGLLSLDTWGRPAAARGQKRSRERPFEQKESYKWLRAMERSRRVMATLLEAQRPRLIHVADREGDVHEVFQAVVESEDGCVLRSTCKRQVATEAGGKAWAHEVVAAQPPLGEESIEVPRKHNQPARRAVVELRACRVRLEPSTKHCPQRRPIELNLLSVAERGASSR